MIRRNAAPRADLRAANRLLVTVGRHGGPWVAILAVNVLVLAVAEAALPAVLGRTIDAAVGRIAADHWLLWSTVLIAVLVVSDVVDELGSATATARATAWLRRTTIRRLVSVPLRRLDAITPGDLVSRAVGNTESAGGVAPDAVGGASALLLSLAGVIALAVIDPWLCVVFLAGLPLILLMLRVFTRDVSTLSERYLDTQGRIASRLVEALRGARSIAAAGTTEREIRRVLEPVPELHDHGMGMWRAQNRLTAQDTIVLALLEIAVLAVAGVELSHGRISPGELFAASQYVVLASAGTAAVSSLTGLLRERAAASRVQAILAVPATTYGERTLPAGPGLLELVGVTMSLGDRVVIDHLDLRIEGGALVAVVGRSGAGKSQLARLMGRLVEPDEGEVRLDGVPLGELSRSALRSAVGYGFERPALIGSTIGEAIAFGNQLPAQADLLDAARAAAADGFIRRTPHGYDTLLREAPMSGGEVQRLGLARAFVHADRLLILDDVAASLDTVTEHEIALALTGAMAGRTTVLVAHRASTAARAHQVVWLEAGRLRAAAPHLELWREADYRALFEAVDDDVALGTGRARSS